MSEQCKGKTRRGAQCKRRATHAGYCHLHVPTSAVVEAGGLTDSQRAFVLAYLGNGYNGAAAARAVGCEGDYARTAAARWLANDNVQGAIREHFERMSMDIAEVTGRLSDMARGTLAPFVAFRDGFLELSLSGEEAQEHLHLIRKLTAERKLMGDDGDIIAEKITIELHDAKDALKTLLTHLTRASDQRAVEHEQPTEDPDLDARLAELGIPLD